MRVIATVLSCAALLSCSTESDGSRSPLLDQVVRVPGVVWSTESLGCRQISSEDKRLDELSKVNAIERHRLVRARNIQLIQWVIPYYGWVATARAGLLDAEVKNVDLVLEDAADRRQELKQFALTENCAGATAEVANAPVVAPTIAASTPAPRQRDAGLVRPTPASKPFAARAPVVRPDMLAASTAPAPQTYVENSSVILPIGAGNRRRSRGGGNHVSAATLIRSPPPK
ncbi:MAG: hypothetical protein WDO24_00980 [Pseudomonadota bacterium]